MGSARVTPEGAGWTGTGDPGRGPNGPARESLAEGGCPWQGAGWTRTGDLGTGPALRRVGLRAYPEISPLGA